MNIKTTNLTKPKNVYRQDKPAERNLKDMNMEDCVLSGEMRIFVHHIYELQKGIRYMAMCTMEKENVTFAIQKLGRVGFDYEIRPVNTRRLNLFFGKKECIDIVRMLCNRPLNQLSPEEDFILGALLGYDVCQQCERYRRRKKTPATNG